MLLCKKKYLVISLLTCFSSFIIAEVKLILTAALTTAHFETRKSQYINAINALASFGYENPYIVESLAKKGPTFLDDYSTNVFYATCNDPRVKNQGINEAQTLLEALNHFEFDPDDMIIKVTGRYQFISGEFLKLVTENQDYDAIILFNSQHKQLKTLCFAMKCKYMKEMFQNIDYVAMERKWIILETATGQYIINKRRNPNFKILYVDKVGIKAELIGSSTAPGASATWFF